MPRRWPARSRCSTCSAPTPDPASLRAASAGGVRARDTARSYHSLAADVGRVRAPGCATLHGPASSSWSVTTMCFDLNARPPIPAIAGGATDARDLKLTSADGTQLMAYAARAVNPTGAGMIVLPDVRGLHQYYKDLALRFAEHGVDAVAIDYFARTAPSNDRGESFDWMPHVQQTRDAAIQSDVAAAAAFLRSPEGGNARSL